MRFHQLIQRDRRRSLSCLGFKKDALDFCSKVPAQIIDHECVLIFKCYTNLRSEADSQPLFTSSSGITSISLCKKYPIQPGYTAHELTPKERLLVNLRLVFKAAGFSRLPPKLRIVAGN